MKYITDHIITKYSCNLVQSANKHDTLTDLIFVKSFHPCTQPINKYCCIMYLTRDIMQFHETFCKCLVYAGVRFYLNVYKNVQVGRCTENILRRKRNAQEEKRKRENR